MRPNEREESPESPSPSAGPSTREPAADEPLGGEQPAPAPIGLPRRTLSERMIDQTLEQSFPASDPPSWTLGI